MLEEMTGQLREEVSTCSMFLWSNYLVFGGVYLLFEGGGEYVLRVFGIWVFVFGLRYFRALN